jgi:16S rRNA (adenine1518-N6/adenine1519-N6)-dimethyltransferase
MTNDLLRRHGITLNKALGQNFLVNPKIPARIADNCGCGTNITALEIGPGAGILSRELARRCKQVICVELDRRLEPVLAETLADCENAEVIFADALKADLRALLPPQNETETNKNIVCANLPYYITTPLILRLLEEELPLTAVTVMIQKETAARILALPGTRECGAISAAIRFFGEPRKLFDVGRGNFFPVPNVDSSVIRIDIIAQENRPPVSAEAFRRLTRCVFSQRRKVICGMLAAEYGLSKEQIRQLVPKAGARAEELTMDELVGIAGVLGNNE